MKDKKSEKILCEVRSSSVLNRYSISIIMILCALIVILSIQEARSYFLIISIYAVLILYFLSLLIRGVATGRKSWYLTNSRIIICQGLISKKTSIKYRHIRHCVTRQSSKKYGQLIIEVSQLARIYSIKRVSLCADIQRLICYYRDKDRHYSDNVNLKENGRIT